MNTMFLLAILAVLCVIAGGRELPSPISSIQIDGYLGHWLQVYQAPTNILFQGYGTCITADYGLLDNGNVSVLNAQLDEKREIETIAGYGYYKNASEPGKLTVHLEGVPVDSPYWILKLGEVVDNQYQYSIITTPSYISLWVLTRNLTRFFEKYDAEVVEFLNQCEFKYIDVLQEDCGNNKAALLGMDTKPQIRRSFA